MEPNIIKENEEPEQKADAINGIENPETKKVSSEHISQVITGLEESDTKSDIKSDIKSKTKTKKVAPEQQKVKNNLKIDNSIIPAIAIQTKSKPKTKPKAVVEEKKLEDCSICGDLYTKKYRRKLECRECKQECCLRCFQTYLMDNPMQCMYPDCKKNLDVVEIRKIVTNNAFCKRLDDNLAQRMLDEEKTRLPFYQPFAQIEIEKKKYQKRHAERNSKKNEIKSNIASLRQEVENAKYNINSLAASNRGEETKDFLEAKEFYLNTTLVNLHTVSDLSHQMIKINLEDEMDRVSVGFVKAERKEYTFIKQCAHAGCNGFLERSWMCALCDRYTCPKCHEPKSKRQDDDHVCNEDTVASVEVLKKDSKPCPKCGTGIFKVSGCFDGEVEIIMFDGSVKKVKDVIIGDEIMGIDRTKRTVLDLCQGEDEMYEVVQEKGMNYIVNSKHTLALMLYNNDLFEIVVDEYMSFVKVIREQMYGYKSNPDGTKSKYKISVNKIGRGKYYGFRVDKDNKFLSRDYTVLKNCDQMWCLMCQTAFSWATGKIVTGNIHNPEAFRWQREQGIKLRATAAENQECIDPLSNIYTNWIYHQAVNYFVRNRIIISQLKLKHVFNDRSLESIVRLGIHVNAVSVPALNTDDAEIKQQLGVSYLLNKITEEQWLNEIKTKLVKKRIINRERIQIYGFLTGVLSTLLSNIMQLINTNAPFIETQVEFDNIIKLVEQVNQKFTDLRELFKEGRRTNIEIEKHTNYRFSLRNE